MRAKVLDVNQDFVHLEVDSQLRFTTRYRLSKALPALEMFDEVDFELSYDNGDRFAIIRSAAATTTL